VADDFAFDEVDDHFGDVGGVVADALDVFRIPGTEFRNSGDTLLNY